jgi:hypothetical protein
MQSYIQKLLPCGSAQQKVGYLSLGKSHEKYKVISVKCIAEIFPVDLPDFTPDAQFSCRLKTGQLLKIKACTGTQATRSCPCPGTQGCYGRRDDKKVSADLRLPGMRCCNDHRGNLGIQTALSCASSGRCALSKCIWHTPNSLSFIYLLAPIQEDLAWRLKIPYSAP